MKRLLLALAMLATACAGPQHKVDLGFKEVPSNVVLGAQTSPTPAPTGAPSLIPLPPPPSVVSLPPPPYQLPPSHPDPPPPVPTTPACPPDDVLGAPKLEAPATIAKPPTAAAYVFHNVGTYSVSGADARKGTFPAETLRIFNNVVRYTAGTFDYDMSERIGDVTTTTTYRVATDGGNPAQPNGVFLVKMVYRQGTASAAFNPVQPILLAALPLVRGATSDQRGVDPQSQTVMTFTTTIDGKARVFACGQPLDTWTVHLTKGSLVSPTQNLQFDSTYQIGTQYGGIALSDAISFTGTDNSAGVERSNRATIAAEPRAP